MAAADDEATRVAWGREEPLTVASATALLQEASEVRRILLRERQAVFLP